MKAQPICFGALVLTGEVAEGREGLFVHHRLRQPVDDGAHVPQHAL
jgi:hypothetical protein